MGKVSKVRVHSQKNKSNPQFVLRGLHGNRQIYVERPFKKPYFRVDIL